MSEPRSNKSKLSTDFGINGSTKHILFIVPGQSISLILPDQHINASTRNINWDNQTQTITGTDHEPSMYKKMRLVKTSLMDYAGWRHSPNSLQSLLTEDKNREKA